MVKQFLHRYRVVVGVLVLGFVCVATIVPLAVAHAAPLELIPCGTKSSGDVVSNPCDFNALVQLGSNLMTYLVWLSIPIAAISFAWAGFLYLTSAGNQGKIESAKKIFWNVMWGFIFVLTAWLIVYTIVYFLKPEFSLLAP